MYIVVCLNKESFEKDFDWLRKIKKAGLKCTVFGPNLELDHKIKIESLGFELSKDHPYSLMCEEEYSGFFVTLKDLPKYEIGGKLVFSGVSNYSLEDMVSPIFNLYKRVKIASCLDSFVKKHGFLLGVDYVFAPRRFWVDAWGIHQQWIANDFVEKSLLLHDLTINFCASFYGYSVINGENS